MNEGNRERKGENKAIIIIIIILHNMSPPQ